MKNERRKSEEDIRKGCGKIMKVIRSLFLLIAIILFFVGCDVEVKKLVSAPVSDKDLGKFDLGVTPNYETSNETFDFSRLAKDGFKRFSLYYTWKEFEIGAADPNHPEGTVLKDQVDPVINKLQALGMKTSLIIGITDTDCKEKSPESCWLEYGIQKELIYDQNGKFVGFDNEVLASRLEKFVKSIVQRYPPNVVTHVFIGNETDQYLRLHGHENDFKALMQRLKSSLANIQPRAKFGTIFTFTPDAEAPNYNNIAKEISPSVEVMAFTIYPYIFYSGKGQKIEPTAALITHWFNSARDVAGGKSFVVTETAHPADGDYGSEADQAKYAQLLLEYLNTTTAKIEFINWWAIQDSDKNPEDFRFASLMDDRGRKRPAYNLWAGASK